MKKVMMALIALPMLVLAGCGQPSVQKAQNQFCQNLAKLKQSLVTLSNLTPNSKVGELRKAREEAVKSLAAVKKSAAELKVAKTDALEKADKDLEKTIKNIPNKYTLAKAAETIQPKVAAVEAARAQLESTVKCSQ